MKFLSSLLLSLFILFGSSALRAQDAPAVDNPEPAQLAEIFPSLYSPVISDLRVLSNPREHITKLDYNVAHPGHLYAYVETEAMPGEPPQNPGAWHTVAGLYKGYTPVAIKVDSSGDLVTGADPGGAVTSCTACIVIGGLNGFTPVALNVGSDGTVITSGGGGGGTVTSVSGTANQIDVATGTTTPVISLDPAFQFSSTAGGALTTAPFRFTGNPITGGSGTTTVPLFYFNGGTAPTTWSTNGTYVGVNAVSGFTGNFLDFHLNGGASLFSVNNIGQAIAASSITGTQFCSSGNFCLAAAGGGVQAQNIGGSNFVPITGGPTITAKDTGPFGATFVSGLTACETGFATTTVNTGSATTTTGQTCVPANAMIVDVVYRITTTITTATSFTVGITGSVSKFCSTQSTLTAGTVGHCNLQVNAGAAESGASAVAVIVTFNSTPGAGAIRLEVASIAATTPTS